MTVETSFSDTLSTCFSSASLNHSLNSTPHLDFLSVSLTPSFCPRIPSGYHAAPGHPAFLGSSGLSQFLKLSLLVMTLQSEENWSGILLNVPQYGFV